MVYAEKKIIVVKQLSKLTNYTNLGWFDNIIFMSRKENQSLEKTQTCTEKRKRNNIYIFLFKWGVDIKLNYYF